MMHGAGDESAAKKGVSWNCESAMQRSLEQEVGLEEERLAAVALRSQCRKLESESLFAEVFEKYEEEIKQLQVTSQPWLL